MQDHPFFPLALAGVPHTRGALLRLEVQRLLPERSDEGQRIRLLLRLEVLRLTLT